MRSSPRTITLFAESTDIGQKPTSFVASMLLHFLVIGLVSFGVFYSPRLDRRAIAQRYNLRRLDLAMPDEAMPRTAASKVNYPAPKPKSHNDPSTGQQAVMRQVAQAPKAPQTLLQPDLAKQITLPDAVPVPTLVVWAHNKAVVKTIVAPPPAKPTSANITPSPAPPTQEVNLSNVSIAASEIPHPKLPTLPSTTSPIAVPGPEVQLAPTSISQVAATPTPAAVMSLSDVHMAQGTVVLPPVNQSAASKSEGLLAPGEAHDSAPGTGNRDGKGGSGKPSGTDSGSNGTAGTMADGRAADPFPNGNGTGNQIRATKITLPKNGQFGSVVVGASLEDQFPEMTRVWAGRLAYTVYLHVGLARSWILQYSLPMNDEATAGGRISRLDAPWPYNIVRPNLGIDPSESEAIMVHGYVNQSGRFEGLKVVFPPQFPQTQFILASLEQWQFRPAARNGQLARVEVLLIIPEELR